MKAYLIDPIQRTVEEATYNGDAKQICQLISAKLFDAVRINYHGDMVFVDDEGLLRAGILPAFKVRFYPSPLIGRGLVLGCDAWGNEKEPTITLEALREAVTFGQVASDGQPHWTIITLGNGNAKNGTH